MKTPFEYIIDDLHHAGQKYDFRPTITVEKFINPDGLSSYRAGPKICDADARPFGRMQGISDQLIPLIISEIVEPPIYQQLVAGDSHGHSVFNNSGLVAVWAIKNHKIIHSRFSCDVQEDESAKRWEFEPQDTLFLILRDALLAHVSQPNVSKPKTKKKVEIEQRAAKDAELYREYLEFKKHGSKLIIDFARQLNDDAKTPEYITAGLSTKELCDPSAIADELKKAFDRHRKGAFARNSAGI